MHIPNIKKALSDISLHLEGAIMYHVDIVPSELFKNASRITVPIAGKPSHYLAITLTGVEFIKLEGLS